MSIVRLLICILICQMAGIIGGIFTRHSVNTWYATLNKPSFTPPGWIFGPVWISLYLLMAISLFIIWQSRALNLKTSAILLFILQLILNAMWSALFFGLRSPVGGFIDIVFLLIAIIITAVIMGKINIYAGLLMIPYILWVSFAAVLNFFIMRMN